MHKAETQALEKTRTRSRTWQEEVDMLLSMIDCLVLDREAVYASSEFTTGKRFYELCRRYNIRTGTELKKRLGEEYRTQLLAPNKEGGIRFARKLREFGHKVVLTPHPFIAVDWSQSEYLGFWEEVIQRKCHAVYFNEGWEFSNGCTFEYLAGLKAGMPLLDHDKKLLELPTAKEMIGNAIKNLEKEGFDTPELRRVYAELSSP